jgi:hypothetical protein
LHDSGRPPPKCNAMAEIVHPSQMLPVTAVKLPGREGVSNMPIATNPTYVVPANAWRTPGPITTDADC